MSSSIRESQESQLMIKKILSNALLSIFLDKKAKKNFNAIQKKQEKNRQLKSKINNPSQDTAEKSSTNENRQTLIKNALRAHKENSRVLAELSEDQKLRLRAIAKQILLKPNENSNIKNTCTEEIIFDDTKVPKSSNETVQTTGKKRQTLIKSALAAHKKHTKSLDNLSKQQKKKLQRLAMRTMFSKTGK